MKKLILTAALAASTHASAATLEGDWYTRFSFGLTNPDAGEVENFLSNTIASEVGIQESVDFENPRSYSFHIGYRFSRFFAVEGGYVNFGENNERFGYYNSYGNLETQGFEGIETATYKGEVSGTTRTLGIVVSTDATRTFSAGIRAGIHLWNTRAEIDYAYSDSYRYTNADDEIVEDVFKSETSLLSSDLDGEDAYFGLFANWRIGRWSYSLDHTLYQTDEVEPTVTSLALDYAF